jgi:HD-GYP domain-containing protein (c-di-GMP phosphodiesterase class II)
MKRHSLLGYDIVQAADMPVEARWVRHHHERVDGRGYPDGLAGEEIPLESRDHPRRRRRSRR